jgi:hypothetical protein
VHEQHPRGECVGCDVIWNVRDDLAKAARADMDRRVKCHGCQAMTATPDRHVDCKPGVAP